MHRLSIALCMLVVLIRLDAASAAPGDVLAVLKHPQPGPFAGSSRFGTTLAVSGTQILVGARATHLLDGDRVVKRFVGTGYVFDSTSGDLLYEIPNPVPHKFSVFAHSVAAVGDRFFVSRGRGSEPPRLPESVYAYDASTNDLLFQIPYSGPQPPGASASFADPVAALGTDRLVAAAPSEMVDGVPSAGALYVIDALTGESLLRIPHPNPKIRGDLLGHGLGLATLGNKIIAGSMLHDPFGDGTPPQPGAAFVFDGTTGDLLFRLDNPTPEALEDPPINNDWFGFSVSATDDKILVGAMLEDPDGIDDAGAVHVFDADDGAFLFTIPNPEPDPNEDFGRSVAGVGHHILVGAWRDEINGVPDMGSAYLFHGDTGELLLEIPNPADAPGAFGHTLTSMGNNLVISAPLAKLGDYHSGAVYIIEGIPEPSGSALALAALALLALSQRRRRLI